MPEEPLLPPDAPDDDRAVGEAVVDEAAPSEREATPQARRSPRQRAEPSRKRYVVLEWVVVVAVALVAAFLVRTFVFQTFFIPTGSMEPTLQIGDRIIVSKLSYHLHSVHRGDVIVFHAPPKEATVCGDPNVKDLVKRVIGLPGETISSSGNTILINGQAITQPWFPVTPLGSAIPVTHIPARSFFVMGDNRMNSCDSRLWGTLPSTDIIGHAIVKIWPLSQIGFL